MTTLRLVVHLSEGRSRRFALSGAGTLGSGPEADMRIGHPAISQRHARLEPREGGIFVEDLGSTNGTRVEGRLLREPRLVEPGEELAFGPLRASVERIEAADLEAAVRLPASGPRSRPGNRNEAGVEPPDPTAELGSLQAFVAELLPCWLQRLREGEAGEDLAREIGAALALALPVAWMEIRREGPRGPALVFRSGDRARGDESARVSLTAESWSWSAGFLHERQAVLYRPLQEIALSLVALAADRSGSAAFGPDRRAQSPRRQRPSPPAPATVDPRLCEVYERARIVARSDVSVLIRGESGTGKEVLARYLHAASDRADGPWVALNCAALPKDLLESELFGIERGVATGVEERAGKFELASGGTLLLDEIADMAPETQAKMLRVLQEREIFRLGGLRPRPVDVRIVAATNREPDDLLAGGELRSDLYHRISDWEVVLPSLRRRRGDVLNLAAHFLARAAGRRGIEPAGISRAAARQLEAFDWPGNVRQLEREIQRAALFLHDGELLESRHLSEHLRQLETDPESRTLKARLGRAEREILGECLARHADDVEAVCAELDISRATFYRRIRALGLRDDGSGDGSD